MRSRLRKWVLLLFSLWLMAGCTLDEGLTPDQILDRTPYKFWVAGHAYGHPIEATDSVGLYPPFVRAMPEIAADPHMEFGVLTGDFVKWNEPFRHDSVINQLARYGQKAYKVPGNHDTDVGRDYENWHAYYGPSWYAERIRNDLYFFLDPNLDEWRITPRQIEMMQEELTQLANANNIFVFTHQVLWWHPERDSLFWKFNANSAEGRGDNLNFWSEVVPLFADLEQQVYFFAGDVGAWCWTRPLTYYQSDNIHFVTSGMGCEYKSNYLVVSVNENKEVEIDVEWIGYGELDLEWLGEFEDWEISR